MHSLEAHDYFFYKSYVSKPFLKILELFDWNLYNAAFSHKVGLKNEFVTILYVETGKGLVTN